MLTLDKKEAMIPTEADGVSIDERYSMSGTQLDSVNEDRFILRVINEGNCPVRTLNDGAMPVTTAEGI